MGLLLNVVNPVMEAERILEKDKFRTSVLDEVEPGERLFYPDPPTKMAKTKFKELHVDHAQALKDAKILQRLLDYADSNCTRDLWRYMYAHPRRSRRDFHQKHLAFKKSTARALREAKMQETKKETDQRR